jgi:hypothetical protein
MTATLTALPTEDELLDFAYGEAEDILEAPAVRSSERLGIQGGRLQSVSELTVKRCPLPGARWIVLLLADGAQVWAFRTRREADRFYVDRVRDCEDYYARYGEHAWHTTDVHGIPVVPGT